MMSRWIIIIIIIIIIILTPTEYTIFKSIFENTIYLTFTYMDNNNTKSNLTLKILKCKISFIIIIIKYISHIMEVALVSVSWMWHTMIIVLIHFGNHFINVYS